MTRAPFGLSANRSSSVSRSEPAGNGATGATSSSRRMGTTVSGTSLVARSRSAVLDPGPMHRPDQAPRPDQVACEQIGAVGIGRHDADEPLELTAAEPGFVGSLSVGQYNVSGIAEAILTKWMAPQMDRKEHRKRLPFLGAAVQRPQLVQLPQHVCCVGLDLMQPPFDRSTQLLIGTPERVAITRRSQADVRLPAFRVALLRIDVRSRRPSWPSRTVMPGGSSDKPLDETSLHIGGIKIKTLTGSRRSAEVKGAASRLAPLGSDGPHLTNAPLRLIGNEGPLRGLRPRAGPGGDSGCDRAGG